MTRAAVEWSVAWKDKLADAVREEAPVGGTRQLAMFGSVDASTTLRASLRGRSRGRLDLVIIEVVSRVSYALIIRDGRGTIVPKKAKVLHWVAEDGSDVFAMSSGPVAPNPYPRRAWAKIGDEVRGDLAKRVARAAMTDLLQTAKKGGLSVLR